MSTKSNILNKNIYIQLKHISTASLCTALYKRNLKNQFIQNVHKVDKKNENMVGKAYTLRYIPAREDRNMIEVFRNENHPQRIAVEECPPNYILVMDSRKNSRAASAGSILVTRLMKRGVTGIVTDGGFRDTETISNLNIHSYHNRPSAPTNLTLHEAYDLNIPIGCGDVAVFPNDILVGDHDGVVVIPAYLVHEITDECVKMELFERFVLEEVNNGKSIIGLYPSTKQSTEIAYQNWVKNKSLY